MTTEESQVAAPMTARGERTRKALLKAARQVFERDGFLGARITDIADTAGVAHGTFYTYFSSKEDVFRDLFLDVEATMIVASGGRPPEPDPWRAIEAANRRYLEVYRDNAALIANWEQVAAFNTDFSQLLRGWGNERFVRRIERAIRRWQSQGLADPDIDAAYAAHALGNMATRIAHMMFAVGAPFEFDKAVEQLTRLWANAIGVRPSPVTPARSTTRNGKRPTKR